MANQAMKEIRIKMPIAYRKGVQEYVDGSIVVKFEIDKSQAESVKELLDVGMDQPLMIYVVNSDFKPDGTTAAGGEHTDPSPTPAAPAAAAPTGKAHTERQRHIYRITRLVEDELGWREDFMREKFKLWTGKESRHDMTDAELKLVRDRIEEEVGDEKLARFNDHEEEQS